jgi:hypothetical protein
MTRHLPATEQTTALAEVDEALGTPPPPPRRQRIEVAFLPLALVAFTVLSIVAAAWTVLATAGP